jgi:DNA-directed RNA polymerase specialized sigma24 family protein
VKNRELLRNVSRKVKRREKAAERMRQASEEVRSEIRAARAAGFSLSEIAEVAGVSRQRIHELSRPPK